METVGRVNSDCVLVALSNEEYEKVERFLKLDEIQTCIKSRRFRITGTDHRGITYTVYECDADRALQAMRELKKSCKHVFCSFPE